MVKDKYIEYARKHNQTRSWAVENYKEPKKKKVDPDGKRE